MTLNLDPTPLRRRPADLHEMVDAIVRATPEDEQDWLEWKSTLDLAKRSGQFSLARAILGMANRDPDRARVHAGGLGYVVIGASPDTVQGVDSIDTAKLDDGLTRYLGNDGPQWSANRVDYDGREVLVVIVEAPAAGDQLYPLCASFQDEQGNGGDDGTIFVRSGTKTRPATAANIRMLHRRATAATAAPSEGPEILVTAITKGVPIVEGSKVRAILAQTVDLKSDTFIQNGLHRKLELEEPSLNDLAGRISGLSIAGFKYSAPTWDKYVTEVSEWAAKMQDSAWQEVLWQITRERLGEVALLVESLTSTNLLNVEVVLTLPSGMRIVAFDEYGAEEPVTPDPPGPYGERRTNERFGFSSHLLSGIQNPLEPVAARYGVYIDAHDDGSTTITYVVGNLRPRQIARSEPSYMIITERAPVPNDFVVEWTATSTATDGVRSGELTIPLLGYLDPEKVAETAVSLRRP